MALVEWGDAAAPVLGDGALSVRLEADPTTTTARAVTVTASGTVWDDRWADALPGRGPSAPTWPRRGGR